MVETITPVVHGGSRARWSGAIVLHAAAAAVVAGGFGAALGGVGRLLGAPWGGAGAVVVAVAAVWGFAHEVAGVPFPVPQLRRQVPDWWRTFFSPIPSAALYGAALGIGFLTYLLHATLVVVSVAVFASGRPLVGAALVGPFGLARGLSAIAAGAGPDVVHALAAFARRRTPLAAGNAVALAAVALAAAGGIRGPFDVPGLAGAAVAIAFACSAAWKATHPASWRTALEGYQRGPLAPAVAVAVPIAEGSVVALGLAGARRPEAVLALVLLGAFSLAGVGRWVRSRGRVPCGCFGASEVSLPALLGRNALLALGAAAAASSGAPFDVRPPAGPDVLPFALAAAGAAGLTLVALSVRRSLVGGRS